MKMLEEENDFLSGDCRRFQLIMERRLVEEEEPTEEDRSFTLRHESECQECARYTAIINSLVCFEDEGGGGGKEQDAIREAVGRRFATRGRRRMYAMAAAAAILLAFSVTALTLFQGSGDDDVQFELSVGQLRLNAEDIASGDRFVFGGKVATPVREDALMHARDRLFVALETGSRVSVVSADKEKMTLRLDEGRMAVHLVPNCGVRLSVEVPDGLILVKGTVFVVETRGQKSAVDVVKGAVSVTPPKSQRGRSEELRAGWSFSFREDKASKSVRKSEDNLLRLLGFPPDMRDRNKTEKSTDKTNIETIPDPEKARRPENAAERPAEIPTPAMLLQAARACRAKQDWHCAAENYSRVIRLYPNRPDAITTMLPLAQIYLENLRRPANALDYFRMYQKKRPSGGLGQEALWGECSALRKLGRRGQEERCLERYVENYPNTTYSLMARSRLSNIVQQRTSNK